MRLVVAASVAVATVGCGIAVSPIPMPVPKGPDRVTEASTKVGGVAEATVGSSILRVKDYWVTSHSGDALLTDTGFILKGGMEAMDWHPGVPYRIHGVAEVEGHRVWVVPHPGPHQLKMCVDQKTGEVLPHVLNTEDNVKMVYTFTTIPERVSMKLATTRVIAGTMPYVNYEFVYSGKTGNQLNFLYREFTEADMARPSFFQNVSYDLSEKEIAFKTMRMEILGVEGSKLKARILSY